MQNNNLVTDEDIEFLSKYEQFARFIYSVSTAKDAAIKDLHDANTDQVQQISGKIVAYDDVVDMADFESLRKMHGL